MANGLSTSNLASTLVQRFTASATNVEFRRLSHDRLMEESQRTLSDAVTHGRPSEERIAIRILDNPRDYSRWENEHATLMRPIAAQRLPPLQKALLLNVSLTLIHRKALFEYMRDRQVRGQERKAIIAHFFAQRDYTSSVVAEHGRYLRSAASYLCSSHLGRNVMFDTLFEDPLAEYEEFYASYFRTYCDVSLARDDDMLAKSMRPILISMKDQIGDWRKALIALTQSQSGIWRRPLF